jgi:hypothetical protein
MIDLVLTALKKMVSPSTLWSVNEPSTSQIGLAVISCLMGPNLGTRRSILCLPWLHPTALSSQEYGSLLTIFWFPHMHHCIDNCIHTCDSCQQYKDAGYG